MHDTHRVSPLKNRKADVAGWLLIALTALRIASSWTVFSATLDEGMHVAAGLQIYTQHTWTYGRENPPLPRLVLAMAPWLGGMRFDPGLDVHEQQRALFYGNGRYRQNLALARAGNLVFFLIAVLAVRAWARRELGSTGGLVAVLLFAGQPVVAGHAGLATVDIAGTAGVALSLLAFLRWLDAPGIGRAAAFGAACGFAVLCKFSNLGFVPAACLAVYLVRLARDRRARLPAGVLLRALLVALVCAELVIWTGYGFSFERFAYGLHKLIQLNEGGHLRYLFGELRDQGWWWYFPVAVGLKTTIASLLLGLGALFVRRRRVGWESAAAAGAILAVAIVSHINIGVRHVLPLYVPLSVGGAAVVVGLLQTRRWVPVVLLAWHTVASVMAHPDAFPYFNEAAGRQPWRILSDSNIDWGQDALRLAEVVRKKNIDRIGLAVIGMHDWKALGFPPHDELRPEAPSRGWVAISEFALVKQPLPWLEGRPYERVGTSIRLYSVD